MMAERGIRVPTDVAVAGFNDIEEGRLVRPALTSVSLPFYDQGYQSVETLLEMLAGRDVPDHLQLDSQLLVRQSCGCPSQSIHLAAAEFANVETHNHRVALQRTQENLMMQIARVMSNKGVAATWAKQLVDAFYREITAGLNGQFRSTLDGMLQQGALDGDGTDVWQSAISVLRQEMLPVLDPQTQTRAENLFGQARIMIGEAIQRAQIARQLQADRQSYTLRDIGQALITTFDMNRLADVLAERLPDLEIKSCYLSLYDGTPGSAEWSKLIFAYSDGSRARLDPGGHRFQSCELVPVRFLPARRYSLLVEPLYFQIDPIGFAVFEIGPRDGAIYEVLRGHISTALKGTLLFREAHEARLSAERADQIKTRLLANVSHELRTPLNIIIGHTQKLLHTPPLDLTKDLEHIQHSAEHQLRIINDLLDLSRAEINALDLYPETLNPRSLIEESFAALAENTTRSQDVIWELKLPDRLPMIQADPVRLRQILLNLLSNAGRFTRQGKITLGVELTPPHLHIWVADTGIGIPPDLRERIYDPFFTHERSDQQAGGIGLGLSITKHLVALHGGVITLDSEPGEGSTFHIYLPLPISDADYVDWKPQTTGSTLWLVSNAEIIPAGIISFSQTQNLEIQRLGVNSDFEKMLSDGAPVVVMWDTVGASPNDWALIRRLHNHPQLSQTPFVLCQQEADGEGTNQITSLVVKPASSQALWEAIRPTVPQETTGSVMIVDDDPRARELACEAVSKGLSGYTIRVADNGKAGLDAISADPPSLLILDLMMPDMDGFEVLDRLRADDKTRRIPVVILTGRQLSLSDVKRLEQHASVTLQTKGILSEDEIVVSLYRSLFDIDTLPPQTSGLVKRAISFLQQNFSRPLARTEIARQVGVSEDYLSRMFNRELGISPWDYLNRYRILRAREFLSQSDDTIAGIARRVGFSDPAYFSRVFHNLTGLSPRAYRDRHDD
jgi:signal transduction histidine kinase/AraC-like DNA-binding protein